MDAGAFFWVVSLGWLRLGRRLAAFRTGPEPILGQVSLGCAIRRVVGMGLRRHSIGVPNCFFHGKAVMRRRQPHSSGNTIDHIRRSGKRICGRVQSRIQIAQGSNLRRLECSGGSSPREFEGTFSGGLGTGQQFDQNQQLVIVYASNFPVKRISVWTSAPR